MQFLRVVAVAGLTQFFAWSAFAFDGDEHRLLSTIALEAALKLATPGPKMSHAIDTRKQGPPSFGDVTVAVDWFQDPDDFLKAEDLAKAVRSRNLIMKGLAAHYDYAHFQDGALKAWQKYHHQALLSAKSDPDDALLREAVALHYLQDFFSAGHIVTPRAGMHDAVAGHLHDRYNMSGVTFCMRPSIPPKVLRAVLETNLQTERETDMVDVNAYEDAVTNGETSFHGDDTLNWPEDGAQKVFVAAVSAVSVAQVLDASNDRDSFGLEPCFHRRSASLAANRRRVDFAGPDGKIRIVPNASRTAEPAVVPCGGDSWLGWYEAPVFGINRNDEYYYPEGVTMRLESAWAQHNRGLRTNIDLLYFMLALDPPDRLVDRGTEEPFIRGRLAKAMSGLQVAAVGPSHSSGDGYHAWGLLYDFYQPSPMRALEWGFRLAPRRYTYAHTHHWKFDYGLKGTFGLDVIGIEVAVERAHHMDLEGRFRPTYFVSLGAEASLNKQWFRLFGRKKRR